MRNLLRVLLLLLALLVILPASAATDSAPDESHWLDVEVGQSLIWRGEQPIARILVSDPAVADIKLLEQEQFQVQGIKVGSTDLWVWYRADVGRPVAYEITVHENLSDLVRRVASLVPDAPPRVYPLRGRLVVDGPVPDVETLEQVASMARVFDAKFVNRMTVEGDHQVQLHVVFAEVSRTGVRELGVNAFLWGPEYQGAINGPENGDSVVAGSVPLISHATGFPTTGAFQVLGSVVIDDLLLGVFLGALEENRLSKVLAEPTLVALSGQQAEFMAGGELPIVITTNNQVQVEFKEYGTKLVFVPTVLAGNVIDLRVYTEVSEIDENTGIQAGGVVIPGLISRKGSSHLRIENGKTFAMAGLIGETIVSTRSEIPGLGAIPLIGTLFRYTRHERDEREIMIFVTPRLVRPLAPEDVPAPPTATEDNNPGDIGLFLLGLDHRPGSGKANTAGPMGMER